MRKREIQPEHVFAGWMVVAGFVALMGGLVDLPVMLKIGLWGTLVPVGLLYVVGSILLVGDWLPSTAKKILTNGS